MRRALATAALALCALGACSKQGATTSAEPGAPGTHAVERPALHAAREARLRPRREVAVLVPDAAWASGAASVGPLKPGAAGPAVLHLGGAELDAEAEDGAGGAARIALAPELGAFNRVEVDVAIKQANAQKRSTLVVATFAEGRQLARELVPVPFGPGLHTVAFDLPYGARRAGRPDALSVGLQGAERWALARVALFEDDWAARLPMPGAPAPVEIAEETRPAVGLTSVAPLETSFVAPPDSELLVGWGIPAELGTGSAAPVLVAHVLRGEDVVHTVRCPSGGFESGNPEDLAWVDARVPLGAGGPLTVRFELEVEGRLPAYAALASPLVVRRARASPTVLLITSDTHRYDHVRVAGASVELDTPALDRLAREGVFFEGCFTSTNVTNPSHAALMTGVHPRDTRVLDNVTALADEASTLAEAFRDAGYVTLACVSVPHLGHARSGLGQGFDRASTPRFRQRPAAESVARLERWLDDAGDLPVFAWLHLFDAHTPYEPPAAFDRRYYPAGHDPYDAALPEPERFRVPADDLAVRDLEFPAAQYRAEVTSLDDALDGLLERPRVKDGVVLFTADHGESLGAHEIWWAHAGLYPDTVHVPLILRYPGARVGSRVRTPVRQIDAGRTLLDLAGLERVPFEGRNLVRAAETEPEDASPFVAEPARFLVASHAQEAAIHHGRWLLVLCLDAHPVHPGLEHARHRTELYDLVEDSGCARDRAADERETATRLRRELIEWLLDRRSLGIGRSAPGGVGTEDELAALGYTAAATDLDEDAPLFELGCDCERCRAFE